MSARPPLFTNSDVIFSLKTFAAAMLAYLVAISFDLSRPFWAVGTVYIIANPLSGAITSKALYRLIGTISGGVMTVVLVPALVNTPWLLIAALILWVSGCLFISLLDRTPRSYAFLLSGYTVLLAGLPVVDTPLLAFDTAVSRVEEIAVAIICAAVISRIFLPRHTGPVLVARVDAWARDAADLARDSFDPASDPDTLRRELRRLAGDSVEMRTFATHVAFDTSHHRDIIALTDGLQHRMALVLPLLSALRDQFEALEGNPAADGLREYRAQLVAWMGESAANPGYAQEMPDLTLSPATGDSWQDLMQQNARRRLQDLAHVWRDCRILRAAIMAESISPQARAILGDLDRIPWHRDYGMAFLSAFATGLTFLIGTVFWIQSGWHNAYFIPQIGGVFCCILATMDNPVPAMRKFLPLVLWAMLVAFVYAFAVMPFLDSFVTLVAALGLFLIPAGIFLAIPRLFMVGMGLCINFPFMLGLQARPSMDMVNFLDPNISTIMGIVLAILVCGMVRAVGAETSARRLMRAGWREIAAVSSRPARHGLRLSARLIDLTGLLASRLVVLPPGSDALSGDLLRDMRAGVNLSDLRRQSESRPAAARAALRRLIDEVAGFYRTRRSADEKIPARIIALLDQCLKNASRGQAGAVATSLAALRLSLVPTGEPQLPAQSLRAQSRPITDQTTGQTTGQITAQITGQITEQMP
ncbi:FUSC family protein [Xinfangfangia sp. D13-10-4-6]|uniref:FUSC family protein n=1 Tax=Pseudogemmobacter hezensis TaxID=2737662 RepID=UPI001553B33E|nr:FUSC family protein [Pseudogemmobacter hezensis]NPD17723.1 FUSC family protein [Pseudogemmobacter hezensis]